MSTTAATDLAEASTTAQAMASQVRQELRRQGVTQDDVAQYLQVQRVTINRMLNQRSAVGPLPLWDKIAAGLGGRWVVTFERDDT